MSRLGFLFCYYRRRRRPLLLKLEIVALAVSSGKDCMHSANRPYHRAKGRTRDRWDAEWGSLDREGNLWWQGSAWKEWTSVMGTSWVGWICE